MLLTYESFAEIPDKMHTFYAQAFDTLFQRHDAQKEQYQRKTHTGLSREDFRACFAAFCALSYLEERFSFDETSLLRTANAAVSYLRGGKKTYPRLTPAQLVHDLEEAVCMLQPDGREVAFVHRSFQEYFTAVFVTNLHGPKTKPLLDRCASRPGDSVLRMALDIDRDTIEQEWIKPTLNELEATFGLGKRGTTLAFIFSKMFNAVSFLKIGPDRYLVSYEDWQFDVLGRYETLSRVYPEYLGVVAPAQLGPISEEINLRSLILNVEFEGKHNFEKLREMTEDSLSEVYGVKFTITISAEDSWWMSAIGFADTTVLRDVFPKIRKEIDLKEERRMEILNSFV